MHTKVHLKKKNLYVSNAQWHQDKFPMCFFTQWHWKDEESKIWVFICGSFMKTWNRASPTFVCRSYLSYCFPLKSVRQPRHSQPHSNDTQMWWMHHVSVVLFCSAAVRSLVSPPRLLQFSGEPLGERGNKWALINSQWSQALAFNSRKNNKVTPVSVRPGRHCDQLFVLLGCPAAGWTEAAAVCAVANRKGNICCWTSCGPPDTTSGVKILPHMQVDIDWVCVCWRCCCELCWRRCTWIVALAEVLCRYFIIDCV